MPLTCPRCRRSNPEVANFCYFDGQMLRAAGGDGAAQARVGQLGREFFFASGRRCRTLDEFAVGCRDEWDDARSLLKHGHLAKYLDGIGRPDLADSARESSQQSDADSALYAFLQALPSTKDGPRLDVQPRRLMLDGVRTGEQRQVKLTIRNGGKGRLQGRLAVREGSPWLALEGGKKHLSIQANDLQQCAFRIDSRGLIAGQSYSGKLVAITNGGIAEVPVRVDVAALPFPRSPYQGATSPRELAEKMRANPKPAAALLENGDIARWFTANGWAYPVPGTPASGIAAVQQFFEYLGLSRPPAVETVSPEITLTCEPARMARGELAVRTNARKWVYVQAQASEPWLRLLTPTASGAQLATLAFEVNPERIESETATAEVLLTANGGQKLRARVVANCPRPKPSFGWRLLQPILAGLVAAVVWRLLLAAPNDVVCRSLLAARPPTTLADWAAPFEAGPDFLRSFVAATWWIGALLGIWASGQQGGGRRDRISGLIAGSAGGLAAAATFAAVMTQIDAVPRAALSVLPMAAGRWPALVIWIATAVVCWAGLGLAVGLAATLMGGFGRSLLKPLIWPIAALGRALRWAAFDRLFDLR